MSDNGVWEIVGDWTVSWSGALCQGLSQHELDDFYPEKGTAQVQAARAKAICNGAGAAPICPRREQCLEYALEHHERFGIWGGLSERERDRLKKDRAVEAERAEQERAERRARRAAASRAGWERRRQHGGRSSATA